MPLPPDCGPDTFTLPPPSPPIVTVRYLPSACSASACVNSVAPSGGGAGTTSPKAAATYWLPNASTVQIGVGPPQAPPQRRNGASGDETARRATGLPYRN